VVEGKRQAPPTHLPFKLDNKGKFQKISTRKSSSEKVLFVLQSISSDGKSSFARTFASIHTMKGSRNELLKGGGDESFYEKLNPRGSGVN